MKDEKTIRQIISLGLPIIFILSILFVLYRFNYIPHKFYSTSHFNIIQYKSDIDMDSDGIDDQMDILLSSRKYLDKSPKYKSKYYASGYPNDEFGVCTDVVANGLKGAGYDLMELVNADITKHPDRYNIDVVDKNIDFRRVVNLKKFFDNNAISLTSDYKKIAQWQGGDIVLWENHIGIISDNRNKKGIPFVLHHSSPVQANYEEDILEVWGEIIGHYRIS